MARQKLENIVAYAETKLKTISDLDTVKYTDRDSETIMVKRYGAQIYIGADDPSEDLRLHLGNVITERWNINLDIIIKKFFSDRNSVSDSKGISYWIDTIKALFLNGTNGGVFRDSYWEVLGTDPSEDSYVIRGNLFIEVLNIY